MRQDQPELCDHSQPEPDDEAQRWLRNEFEGRRKRVKQGLDGADTFPAAVADVAVPVVIREFDPPAIIRGAMKFAAMLTPAQSDLWFRSYTRAIFLFGNPRNLSARHEIVVSADNDSAGWLGIVDRERLSQLRRLLRPVAGELRRPDTMAAADAGNGRTGAATEWELWLAIRGLDIAHYLIHLHHTVAEAVLTGKLRDGDGVRLRHTADLGPDLFPYGGCRRGFGYARVHISQDDPERLRPYALLRRRC
jgi:hypothetical protein